MATDRRDRLVASFQDRFGRPPVWLAEAPGRVNLIGEHTDYNGGFVLPVALDRTALVAAAPADEPASRAWSANLDDESTFDAGRPQRSETQSWGDYVRGAAWALLARTGHPAVQVDLAIDSDVPMGAGLSSSAALEVAAGAALAAATGASLSPLDLAHVAHRAETEFVGVPCGIMDQFASCLAVEGHALLIDCRSEQAEAVPLGLERQGVALVVVDSAVRRELARSAYRERREQCDEAVRRLRGALPREVASLRDARLQDLDLARHRLPELLLRRARHVVSENARVGCCVQALRQGRLEAIGFLMGQSHRSLRDDYQVSCPELDLLVELAWQTSGVLGARLTGAGFGGCTVNLVYTRALDRFQQEVVEEYRRRTGRPARMFVCRAAGGARLATL